MENLKVPVVLDPQQFQTVLDGLAELPGKRMFDLALYLLQRRQQEIEAIQKPEGNPEGT